MNSLIDTLNVWGEHAFRFAWPMLWQSSLLIALVLALDLLMRRRVRPAVRYALWLLVGIKLLLPPSLALPTSVGWWLRPATAAPARPQPRQGSVSYGDPMPLTELASIPPTTIVQVLAPPPPRLTAAAWGLMGVVAVGLGLVGWMFRRWYQVAGISRRAAPAPGALSRLLPELPRACLKVTDAPQSPAVCGLFRPVILVPRRLVEQLAPAQLRAVLLHEWVHLRRGDVWVNCAQALLQVVYWWHPLVWLANARIRRLREEAVDDAVMLALEDEAEEYAPTLLEVAKLGLQRPLASLGLVGILESHHSLRDRIERLLEWRAPRKAGLTLGSVVAVVGFAALAVPMGEAPAPSKPPQPMAPSPTTNALVPQEWVITNLTDQGSVEYQFDKGMVIGRGGVLCRYGDAVMTAENITANLRSGEVVADGKVRVERAGRVWIGDHVRWDHVRYNFSTQEMLVTSSSPDRIDAAFAARPQINVRARFIELSEQEASRLWRDVGQTNETAARMAVLTARQTAALLKNLGPSGEVIASPQSTIVSGRPLQMKMVDTKSVITGIAEQALKLPGVTGKTNNWSLDWSRVVKIEQIELGPVLDVLPTVLDDGFTVGMSTLSTLTRFSGYADPTNQVAVYVDGQKEWVFVPQPKLQVRQIRTEAQVRDGQTLMVGNPVDGTTNNVPVEKPGDGQPRLIVLVTPTLIHSTGDPIHSDKDMPSASDAVSPQPSR
jgi:beta-lactamase regulating signal transducer with metallopeptidase domain